MEHPDADKIQQTAPTSERRAALADSAPPDNSAMTPYFEVEPAAGEKMDGEIVERRETPDSPEIQVYKRIPGGYQPDGSDVRYDGVWWRTTQRAEVERDEVATPPTSPLPQLAKGEPDDFDSGPDAEPEDETPPATEEVARLAARVAWLEEALASVVGELVTRGFVPSDYENTLQGDVDRKLGGVQN